MNESRAAFVPTTSFAKVVGPFANGVPSSEMRVYPWCVRVNRMFLIWMIFMNSYSPQTEKLMGTCA